MKVVAKKLPGGAQYELVAGEKKVIATRQPDMFFEIELDGNKHKGYLKDLKDRVAAWAQGVVVPPPAPKSRAPERETAPLGFGKGEQIVGKCCLCGENIVTSPRWRDPSPYCSPQCEDFAKRFDWRLFKYPVEFIAWLATQGFKPNKD